MFKESMKYAILLIILLGTQAINVHAWEIDQISPVTRVVDGDSFHITGDEVRLADVNAPEWNQTGGPQATNALTSLISGKTVYLDTDDKSGRDPYGRLVAVVYIAYNSTHYMNVNKELLLEGTVVIDDFTNNEFNPYTWTLYVPKTNPPPPASYTLVIQYPDGSGSTNPTTGSYTYSQADNVPILATPASGYKLDHWVLDGANVGNQNPYTVLMNSNHELKVVFTQSQTPARTVIIDQASVNSSICDIGSRQNVRFHARWDNGSAITSGSIQINDDHTIFDSSGWAVLTEISQVTAKRVYFVKGLNCSGVTEFTQVATSPSIIWDRVDVTLSIVADRIDVGSNAAVEWTAIYAFDGTPFKGTVALSGPIREDLPDVPQSGIRMIDHIGKRRFTAESIHDDRFGLTSFSTNSVDCVWDRVYVTLSLVDSRIDVGSMAELQWKAYYEYDGSPFTGRVILTPIDNIAPKEAGDISYSTGSILDGQYGLTVFDTNSVKCVWDRVKISKGGVSSPTTHTGNMETVWFKAVYEYDNSSFTGEPTANGGINKIFVNGIPLIWSSFDKVWKYSTKLDDNGKLTFEVTGVEDMQYKLTKFVDATGPQSITWEKPFLETTVGIVSVAAVMAMVVAASIYLVRITRRKPTSLNEIDIGQSSTLLANGSSITKPRYFGTTKGSIIKAIVIDDLHDLEDIKRSVGVSDDEFMVSLYGLLRSDDVIGTHDGTFDVNDEVKLGWVSYYKVRL
jgi:hypothetical protein